MEIGFDVVILKYKEFDYCVYYRCIEKLIV